MDSALWLIGAGSMGQAYAAVLQAQGVPFRVIGRSRSSADAFQQATGLPVFCGGLDNALRELPVPHQAIVAVGVEQLASVSQKLIAAGSRRLLLEKPGAIDLADLQALHLAAQADNAQVYIAYNRRFYASVRTLRERVIADGGITSAFFEFTEWSHKIRKMHKEAGVKERWLLSNSSHVLDLAFSLIGYPSDESWTAWHDGSLDWHQSAARFHGAGITQLGIPFAYHSDWEAPGRWGLEINTRKCRYILRPMEILQVIHLGSVDIKRVSLDDDLDQRFKPGLYLQTKAFLHDQLENLCSLRNQLNAFPIYVRIAGY